MESPRFSCLSLVSDPDRQFLSPRPNNYLPYCRQMAEIENKPPPDASPPDVKPDEVSLEEIDRLLEADDPEFAQSLNQIKEVGVEGDIDIESVVAG